MPEMKPRPLLLLCLLFLVCSAAAWGREYSLAGIRLEQNAVELIARLDAPDFIGPIGAVVGKSPGELFNAPPSAGAVAAGPTPAAGFASPAPFGALRISFGRGRSEEAAPAIIPGVPVGAVPAMAPQAVHYWLWQRGAAKVAVALTPQGTVTTIMIAGSSLPARTAQGIGLGERYQTIVNRYGFPEGTENRGGYLVLRYPSAGLTFTLDNLKVIGICLESSPGPGSGMVTAPTSAPVLAGAPAAAGPAAPGAPSGGLLGGKLSFMGRN